MSYSVAVRALCEFTAKVGDLDLRFTPSPSAQEGIVGHRTVASRRSAHYQNEVALEGEYRQLKVRGRADGYDPDRNQLEEVKTYRGDLDKQPANHRQLHWAQVKVYGWLMCQKLGLSEIVLALVYFDIVGEHETLLSQPFQAADSNTSSTSNARCSSGGPNRKCVSAKPATPQRRPWAFPMRRFARASAPWQKRSTRPSAPAVA